MCENIGIIRNEISTHSDVYVEMPMVDRHGKDTFYFTL